MIRQAQLKDHRPSIIDNNKLLVSEHDAKRDGNHDAKVLQDFTMSSLSSMRAMNNLRMTDKESSVTQGNRLGAKQYLVYDVNQGQGAGQLIGNEKGTAFRKLKTQTYGKGIRNYDTGTCVQ